MLKVKIKKKQFKKEHKNNQSQSVKPITRHEIKKVKK
jgi:hypothetical protein